jgi:hypothetical protein
MSEYLDWLRRGSAMHATRDRGDSVQVMARDNSDEALKDFQSVAEEVVRRASKGEFKAIPHQSSERLIPGLAGKPYDMVVVRASR